LNQNNIVSSFAKLKKMVVPCYDGFMQNHARLKNMCKRRQEKQAHDIANGQEGEGGGGVVSPCD
jgi:hypothetical protein